MCIMMMPSGNNWKVCTADILSPQATEGDYYQNYKNSGKKPSDVWVFYRQKWVNTGNNKAKLSLVALHCTGQCSTQSFLRLSQWWLLKEICQGPVCGLIGRRVPWAGVQCGQAVQRTRGALRQGKRDRWYRRVNVQTQNAAVSGFFHRASIIAHPTPSSSCTQMSIL